MSTPILLPLSALRANDACDLERRIADFKAHHGHPPGAKTTLQEWVEVTHEINDLLWATRCISRNGRRLAAVVAIKAAWRTLPLYEAANPDDRAPRAALELAERKLAGESIRAAKLRAEAATVAAAAIGFYPAAQALTATFVQQFSLCAIYAVMAAINFDALDWHTRRTSEQAQQRRDFIAELDRLEGR
jgi:hypothetical protein